MVYFHNNYNKEPQNSIGNDSGPYSIFFSSYTNFPQLEPWIKLRTGHEICCTLAACRGGLQGLRLKRLVVGFYHDFRQRFNDPPIASRLHRKKQSSS